MCLYEAPENGSSTILGDADKDCAKIATIYTQLYYTLPVCMSHVGFFPLTLFFLHSPKKNPKTKHQKEPNMCSLFLPYYFCNLVSTAFFFPRSFSICFLTEARLEISFFIILTFFDLF